MAKPLMLKGASTLSAKDSQFANLYDNVFISKDSRMRINGAKVFNFPKYLGLSHAQGRSLLSDHAPIFLNVRLSLTASSLPISASLRKIANPSGSAERNTTNRPPPFTNLGYGYRISADEDLSHGWLPILCNCCAKNRIEFPNEKDAMARDFRRAKNCL